MKTYKCLVVDDEPLARKILEDYISELEDISLMASLKSGIEAKQYLDKNQVDIIFLDINMPKLSGIDLVRNFDLNALIIFTTAYPEYAVEAFEYSGFDYLVKPISFDRFLKSIDKIKNHLYSAKTESLESEYLIIKENKRLYKINQSDILYVQAYGDYIKVITKEKQFVTKEKLSTIKDSLNSNFHNCHRSYIINIQSIEYMEGNHVMIMGEQIPVSLSYKQDITDQFRAISK